MVEGRHRPRDSPVRAHHDLSVESLMPDFMEQAGKIAAGVHVRVGVIDVDEARRSIGRGMTQHAGGQVVRPDDCRLKLVVVLRIGRRCEERIDPGKEARTLAEDGDGLAEGGLGTCCALEGRETAACVLPAVAGDHGRG
jgi:hypothetical protein